MEAERELSLVEAEQELRPVEAEPSLAEADQELSLVEAVVVIKSVTEVCRRLPRAAVPLAADQAEARLAPVAAEGPVVWVATAEEDAAVAAEDAAVAAEDAVAAAAAGVRKLRGKTT